jgi:hypothetical protein
MKQVKPLNITGDPTNSEDLSMSTIISTINQLGQEVRLLEDKLMVFQTMLEDHGVKDPKQLKTLLAQATKYERDIGKSIKLFEALDNFDITVLIDLLSRLHELDIHGRKDLIEYERNSEVTHELMLQWSLLNLRARRELNLPYKLERAIEDIEKEFASTGYMP